MSHIFRNTAMLAFAPFIDLTECKYGTLTSYAALAWLKQKTAAGLGASMYLHPNTRFLLRAGGLEIEDISAKAMSTSNQYWKILWQNEDDFKCDEERIILIKSLMYLGFYDDARRLLDITPTEGNNSLNEIAYYLNILWYQLQQKQPSPNDLKKICVNAQKAKPLEAWQYYSFYLRQLIQHNSDKEEIKNILACCVQLATEVGEYKLILQARTLRLWSTFFDKMDNFKAADYALRQAIELLDHFGPWDGERDYLATESKRRLLDYAAFRALKNNNADDFYQFSIASHHLDPNCARATLIAAEASSLTGRTEQAIQLYKQATRTGVIESPYAKHKLASLCKAVERLQDSAEAAAHHGIQYGCQNGFRSFAALPQSEPLDELGIECWVQQTLQKQLDYPGNNNVIHPPFFLEQYDRYHATDPEFLDIAHHSHAYQRFLPFWEMSEGTLPAPLFNQLPLLAIKSLKENKEPWFETLNMQRAMVTDFRQELLSSVVGGHCKYSSDYKKLADFDGFIVSTAGAALNQLYQAHSESNPLQKIHLAKLISHLGFHDKALSMIVATQNGCKEKLLCNYAASVRLYILNILSLRDGSIDLSGEAEKLFHVLIPCKETLRIRLFLTILVCVAAGRQQDQATCQLWRNRGLETLEQITRCSEYSDFEKGILQSRLYRAISYYPYLIHDKKQLKNDAEVCEQSACTLVPCSQHHSLLKRENFFPAFESLSRIYENLGEIEKAYDYMERIIAEVDPLDTKALIQVGKQRLKQNRIEEALKLFVKAGTIGVPHAQIAWHLAGRCYERLANQQQAMSCYLRSLKAWPNGLSPLLRIRELSKNLGDIYLQTWAEHSLAFLDLGKQRRTLFTSSPSNR